MVRLRDAMLEFRTLNLLISIPIWFDWEVINKMERQNKAKISIPIWFDWEGGQNKRIRVVTLFQFLYGSIERNESDSLTKALKHFNSYMVRLRELLEVTLLLAILHFNSYMVRLRDADAIVFFISSSISIPIWFDWEAVWIWNSNKGFTISIPIWFDWEFITR